MKKIVEIGILGAEYLSRLQIVPVVGDWDAEPNRGTALPKGWREISAEEFHAEYAEHIRNEMDPGKETYWVREVETVSGGVQTPK